MACFKKNIESKTFWINLGQLVKFSIRIIRPEQPQRKQIKTKYKTQFPIKSMLKKEIQKKKTIKKRDQKTNNWSQLVLTYQNYNPCHMTEITLYKTNQNKL